MYLNRKNNFYDDKDIYLKISKNNNIEEMSQTNTSGNCDCMESGSVEPISSKPDDTTANIMYRDSRKAETARKYGSYGYPNWCIIKDQTGDSSCGVEWERPKISTTWKECTDNSILKDQEIRTNYKNALIDDPNCETDGCKTKKAQNDCTCLEARMEAGNSNFDPSPTDEYGDAIQKNTYGSGCGYHGFSPTKWCLTYKQPQKADIKTDSNGSKQFTALKNSCSSVKYSDSNGNEKSIEIKPIWVKPNHTYYYKYEKNCCYSNDYATKYDNEEYDVAKTLFTENTITSTKDCKTKYGQDAKFEGGTTCNQVLSNMVEMVIIKIIVKIVNVKQLNVKVMVVIVLIVILMILIMIVII
jgi:hypothetical protein